ncbi:MAG: helix-turn-helix domain-containing protein [Methylobacter sp.]
MPKLTEAQLLERDAQRDLNEELLDSVRQMKAGQFGRVSVVTQDGGVIESPIAKARICAHLSQAQFADLLGVSVRTLQEWEQGRVARTHRLMLIKAR